MSSFLDSKSSLIEAINAIEKSKKRIAIVLDENKKLIGTLTDGDVRRCLLHGGDLKTEVSDAMNRFPISAKDTTSPEDLFKLMQKNNILTIPIVNQDNIFIKLFHISEISEAENKKNDLDFSFAVIMAGGLGMRLRPITNDIPKPMVDIGGVPLLERQIKKLSNVGIKKVYLAVNYLSNVIEDHFGNGDSHNIEINYLRENESLGTGGALSLLPENPSKPLLVMNGDVLTNSNFESLLKFHNDQENELTVATFSYNIDIPFGVIKNDGPIVSQLIEKPSENFLCNAGIYVLSPKALKHVPKGIKFNMTDLILEYLKNNKKVTIFPIHEYWSDIGTSNDLMEARELYNSYDEFK